MNANIRNPESVLSIPEWAPAIIENYIDGQLVPATEGKSIPNMHPASGSEYGRIAESSGADVQWAYDAASKAFPAWSQRSPGERSQHMLRLAEVMESHLETLAQLESFDNGKPVHVARSVDIPRAISNIRFFATAILHAEQEAHQTDAHTLNWTLRQPLGVVACISPWNLPLYLFTWKIAPALAAGNTVVAKPSEITPATAWYFSRLCIEAGLPAGVLNILHGTGASVGTPLVSHPGIKAVSFTGGTVTGARIAEIAAPQFKKLSLELGGKNPTLVFADCDFEATVKETVRAAFSNQGQICLCGSRIYVERSIYDRFKDAFVERVRSLRVGNPADEANDIGAVVSEAHLHKVREYIALAEAEGGKRLCGGERIHPEGLESGYYLQPTVFENLDPWCRTNQEEIFGPVVTLFPFDTEAEVISYANATRYGLAASVWTTNLTTAHRVAGALQAGIVWINCWMLRDLRTPFGGVKASGVGREGGWDALRFFTDAKNVTLRF
jgi:aminomuconate-semialdehyde/2-hydroxymuconate-6-semialdehyde dehydrogenase